MHRKAFRASFTLSAAGHIGAGDAAQRRDFPLGQRRLAAQTISQADNLCLPPSEAGVDASAYFGAGVPQVQFLQHVVIHPNHINEREGTIFAVAIQGIRQGQFTLELALRAEIHQDFIFNAPAGICGKPDIFVRLKG